jgi:hypothetical protein
MPDPTPSPNNETQTLRAALEAAQRATAAAHAARASAEDQLRTERGARVSAQESAIDTAISQAETEAATAAERWSQLQTDGKFTEAAVAMRQMTEATAKKDRFQAQKEWLTQQRDQQARQPSRDEQLRNFSPEEQAWINSNPRYLTDPEFQQDVNAAALWGERQLHLRRNTPQWFEHIEKAVYPERFTNQQQNSAAHAVNVSTDGGDDPLSDTGEIDGGENVPQVSVGLERLEQQHTRSAPLAAATPDAPAMSIELRPEDPQPRAAGAGSARAVAAPPSRRINAAVNKVTPGVTRIEPTMQELEVARSLYSSIESTAQDQSDDTIIKWYYANYHSPTHRTARRRSWVYPEGAHA